MREKIFKPSKTEDYAIKLIPYNMRNILSIGISTGCSAEVRMAKRYASTRIIATTIDPEGKDYSKRVVAKYGLTKQIQVKLEDVREPMPYPDQIFDLVYARLVLHYLTFADFEKALKEIYRVLRPGGWFYIVMRSIRERHLKKMNPSYDPNTNLITYTTPYGQTLKRQFLMKRNLLTFCQSMASKFHKQKLLEKDFILTFNAQKKTNTKTNLLLSLLTNQSQTVHILIKKSISTWVCFYFSFSASCFASSISRHFMR